jgi:hypothetical protein
MHRERGACEVRRVRKEALNVSLARPFAGTLSIRQHCRPGSTAARSGQTIAMPEVPAGPCTDHMALDIKGQRLFTTPQANKAVDVLDLKTGKVLHTIPSFGNPHSILYRADRNRLFVSDGSIGSLRIFDATTYREIKSIKLELDADGIGYDDKSGYLYVSNGGDAAGKDYSFISIIDTVREEKVGDIRIEAPGLEAMLIDHANDRLYIKPAGKQQHRGRRSAKEDCDRHLATHQGQEKYGLRVRSGTPSALPRLPGYGRARKHRHREHTDRQRTGAASDRRLG